VTARLGSVKRLLGPQGALQGLDRVGPLGGQVLGGSATGTFKLQGVLEFSNPDITRLAGRSATRGLIFLFSVRCSGLVWPQAGCEQVLGRDSPEPTLTGDGTWLLVGGWQPPGGQVAADRRDRHPAQPSRLSDRQARSYPRVMFRVGMLAGRLLLGVVTAVPTIWCRFPGAHGRSLSRSVRSVLTDLSAVEQLSMVASTSAARSARASARRTRTSARRCRRQRTPPVKQLSALPVGGCPRRPPWPGAPDGHPRSDGPSARRNRVAAGAGSQ
jgi:hypothetical protein